ncbi:RNA-binding protein [Methanobrevibacter sp. 87.7]|uniref:exosome complex RNA-binding protein Rrp4 n=1 Tax=Methanobrevibacter sp. 87.7 TaxID=387957 RepID=UPI000B4FF6B6|nr:exosome complex RNA-binding protein Rrp4 [Methanobrevibacter sp. 87.7]OWT32969.1 RNA-binding protein [Methanobrevibacter sp. 87.7]
MIYVENKDLVIPGEVLAEDDFYSGRGTFRENGKICSSLMGLVSLRNRKVSVIPLKSKYIPKKGDVIIGKINDVKFSMWNVDINSPYSGILPASEVFGRDKKNLNRIFNVGDVLFLRVVDVDEVKKAKLGLKGRGMGKFKGGIIVSIAPTKVPRLIGKKGSMINMIKDKTGCKIVVGQNGLVWVKGEKDMEQITKNVIKIIEKEAHTSGLTNRIRDKLYLDIDGEIPEGLDDEEYDFESEVNLSNNDNFDDDSNNHRRNSFANKHKRFNKKFNRRNSFNKKYELEKPRLQNFKAELEQEELEAKKKEDKKRNDDFINNLENIEKSKSKKSFNLNRKKSGFSILKDNF